ncbi:MULTISPECIES: hypothetical protein [Enterococcus]|uniref:hypothetical protein n=1 Tax=Enterococcus sp. BSD2780061688st2 D3 TaxID=2559707 RepID=UPI001E3D278C|nr:MULTISPECIES: hypothetical protein [Enterococcus]
MKSLLKAVSVSAKILLPNLIIENPTKEIIVPVMIFAGLFFIATNPTKVTKAIMIAGFLTISIKMSIIKSSSLKKQVHQFIICIFAQRY